VFVDAVTHTFILNIDMKVKKVKVFPTANGRVWKWLLESQLVPATL